MVVGILVACAKAARKKEGRKMSVTGQGSIGTAKRESHWEEIINHAQTVLAESSKVATVAATLRERIVPENRNPVDNTKPQGNPPPADGFKNHINELLRGISIQLGLISGDLNELQ